MNSPNTVQAGHSAATKPIYARASDTAKHLCIGKSTLWQWCGSGPGSRPGFPKPIKAGPKVSLFDLTAIEAYLKAQAGHAMSTVAAAQTNASLHINQLKRFNRLPAGGLGE